MAEQSDGNGGKKFMAFDPKITLGNYVTIGIMLVSITIAFAKLATRDELNLSIKEMQKSVDEMKKDYVTREVNTLQIQLLGRDLTALAVKVDEIKTDVKDIKRVVR